MINKGLLFVIALFIVTVIVLFLLLVFFIETSIATDCSKIKPTEENKLTEEEAQKLILACENFQNTSYIMIFVALPIFGVVMFLSFILPMFYDWDDIKRKIFGGKKIE